MVSLFIRKSFPHHSITLNFVLLQKIFLYFATFFFFFFSSRPKNEDPLANRTILYQMVALYDYNSQGPEDLELSEGDTIDILSEGM